MGAWCGLVSGAALGWVGAVMAASALGAVTPIITSLHNVNLGGMGTLDIIAAIGQQGLAASITALDDPGRLALMGIVFGLCLGLVLGAVAGMVAAGAYNVAGRHWPALTFELLAEERKTA